ncbi:response regulator [Parvularcula lutaonensis]|uniref:Response regulator n=1 Tax=Parvularcula lutaonensis TaxID=491923 RepID=A0ABV7MBI5_9PROT|nr:response regulator [Parvularcula lutaonensis]GGY40124.1 response regulator [Parvularcula lutaonensis]
MRGTTTPAVLVCEDDPIQAKVLAEGLMRRGMTVIGPCATPEDAKAQAERHEVSAALLDVSLEGGSCADAASVLAGRGVPFAFITGYSTDAASTLRKFSDHLVVPKPIPPDLLDQIIDTLIPPAALPAE